MKLKSSTLYRWPSMRWGDSGPMDDNRLPDAVIVTLMIAFIVNSMVMVYI